MAYRCAYNQGTRNGRGLVVSYLATVQSSPKQEGKIIVIAGDVGLGKSTLVAGAPNRLYVPTEIGEPQHNSLPLVTSWETVIGLLDELIQVAQSGAAIPQCIVWDSVTAMERLLFDYTVRHDPDVLAGKKLAAKLTMETSHGAYGKAYAWARDRFEEFINKCDLLSINVGTNHILTCHTFTERVVDPTVGEYDKTSLLLYSPKNSKSYGPREFLEQRASMIGLLRNPILISKGEKFNQAMDAGQGRVLSVDKQPSFTAKNRFNLTNDIPMIYDYSQTEEANSKNLWNTLANAVWNGTQGKVDLWSR